MKNHSLHSEKGQGLIEYALMMALVVLVVVLALSLTGTTLADVYCNIVRQIAPDTAPGCSAYVQEEFVTTGDWITIYGKTDWSINDGEIEMRGGDQRIINTAELPDDYRVTVNQAVLEGGPGYGILFRQTPNGTSYSGYSFQVDKGLGNKFAFRRFDRNGVELGAPLAVVNTPGKFDWQGPHKIEVEVRGSTFKAYIDGTLVLTATDSTYPTGKAGLRTWHGTKATFGSFTVSPP